MPSLDPALDRLRLTQLLSPNFPIGAFAHSQGLETAIADGLVGDAASLEDWVATVLARGSGHMDGVFFALTLQGDIGLDDLTDLFHAFAASSGRAREAAELGTGFQTLVAALGTPSPPLPYPIASGLACRGLAIPADEILALWLQSYATQLISVAVRYMPLGQAQGQKTLANLAPLIARKSVRLAVATPDDLHSFAPGTDIASMRHETQHIRIFRT